MPAEDRISRLIDVLFGDLSQEKLESFGREFNALAQDLLLTNHCSPITMKIAASAAARK